MLPFLAASPRDLLAFFACVAAATIVQNLTGFALGLVLLGLLALFDLMPVAQASNVATVLALVNAAVYFRSHRAAPPWRLMRPALAGSVPGTALGVALLGWLSANATEWLRLLLGLSVVASAVVLVLERRRRDELSPPSHFAVAGLFAGVLGGLFSTSGPPIVFHMYRQPLEMESIRRALVLVFALNASVRLVLLVASGGFGLQAALLGAVAVPLVSAITHGMARRPIQVSRRAVGVAAAGLLVLTGATLALSAGRHLWGG